MRKCPSCGFRNIDTRETCLKCKTSLVERFDLVKEESPRAKRFAGLTNVFYRGRRYWMRRGRRIYRALKPKLPADVPHRYPFNAAFLSLVPGLGQLYNHQPKKALYFVLLFGALLGPTIIWIKAPLWGTFLLFVCFMVVMYSYTDALVTAATINGRRFTLRNKLAALTYPIFMVGMLAFLGSIFAWAHWPVYTLFKVKGAYMAPALKNGDRIFHEGLSYLLRAPRPGDVVRYNPPSYKFELPGQMGTDIFVVDAMNGWERVMATEGETLTARDGRYFVDGRELSPAYYPLASNEIKQNFSITCPEDHFIILITRVAETSNITNLLSGVTKPPDPDTPGLIMMGWEEACEVDRDAIWNRAVCIYYPGPRRRFFDAEGPRFLDERKSNAE